MEIIYKTNDEMSNFAYCSKIFKGKTPLNGFNKVTETMFEQIGTKEYNSRNVYFNDTIEGTLYLCYPLSVVIKEKIKFSSLHELIKGIRDTYKKIYRSQKSIEKYGVWGHGIYDLCIESIKIYEGNIIDVSIGS